jgi:hypothetical protein
MKNKDFQIILLKKKLKFGIVSQIKNKKQNTIKIRNKSSILI